MPSHWVFTGYDSNVHDSPLKALHRPGLKRPTQPVFKNDRTGCQFSVESDHPNEHCHWAPVCTGITGFFDFIEFRLLPRRITLMSIGLTKVSLFSPNRKGRFAGQNVCGRRNAFWHLLYHKLCPSVLGPGPFAVTRIDRLFLSVADRCQTA